MFALTGCHFPKDAVLYAVFFYLRYTVSYRDLEEIMTERGVRVDHTTLNTWVVKYSPMVAARAHSKKRLTLNSLRMDETYLGVRGKWMYLYRAVDKAGNTLDFMVSERRNAQRYPDLVGSNSSVQAQNWKTDRRGLVPLPVQQQTAHPERQHRDQRRNR
ncbi:DDE domain-containing protein [Ruegeria halocynthiae]|uniref:DDE domain-containing protein n=1 Tax=Ruegeria halocynthiae TaxID=985054 RepID=A0A1H3EIH5_9RHOB|nr:DDE domain-containing protein [Ruegeria halocynthiae]